MKIRFLSIFSFVVIFGFLLFVPNFDQGYSLSEDEWRDYADKLNDSWADKYDKKFDEWRDYADKLNDSWADKYDSLVTKYNKLLESNNHLFKNNKELAEYSESLNFELDILSKDNRELKFELDKPKTVIEDTKVHWHFYDSKGNYYHWDMPIATYEWYLNYSNEKSKAQWYDDPLELGMSDGQSFSTINLDGFVIGSFSKTVDVIYENSNSNADFIYEVWHIVSQLTVYDSDVSIDSEGRYAVETFTRTGGDCEDLVILIADLIVSSSYTKDWTIQYIYMDTNDISSPKTVDHVILYVHDGTRSYYIEATGDPDYDYYPNGVTGWFVDV